MRVGPARPSFSSAAMSRTGYARRVLSKGPFSWGSRSSASRCPLTACEGATEISLDVRTNLPCTSASSWRGIAVSVGEPGADVESRAPVLTTTKCSAGGEIGTLTIVPSGSKNAEVGIRVVAGLSENPEDCSTNAYEGCVVSRRTITYLTPPDRARPGRPHERLRGPGVRREPHVRERLVHRHRHRHRPGEARTAASSTPGHARPVR